MKETKIYLGDAVYCEFDGYQFRLTTEDGMGPTNEIFLEPQVLDILNKFADKVLKPQEEGEWG